MRTAIVDNSRCKPSKCRQECRKSCPVVTMGKLCIEVKATDPIAFISEELCNGCGICVKKCPFKAVKIINLPSNLETQVTHRYGPNSFKLHRLPQPRKGEVLGIIGSNGLGKSSILKILAGKEPLNLGKYDDPPTSDQIIKYFRGSDLQNYFTKLPQMNAVIKPQNVLFVREVITGTVRDHLTDITYIKKCNLEHLLDRNIKQLSGGELQRFCIAVALSKQSDITLIDEFTNYLDSFQTIQMAEVIHQHLTPDRYIILVEHNLAILDYISDHITLLTGSPSLYGVVSAPFSTREGINVWLSGFLPGENLRFRDHEISFNSPLELPVDEHRMQFEYPEFNIQKNDFSLHIEAGNFSQSEVIMLVGENGLGKTTFINQLRKHFPSISYKPQLIDITFQGSVRELLYTKIPGLIVDLNFQREVTRPLKIDDLLDLELDNLSGGEIQRVAITLCLGRPAEIYLIDEPSASLDVECRMVVSKIIRRFMLAHKRTAFVVEHDFNMATNMADKVIVFEGEPGVKGYAGCAESLESGMNKFLRKLGITYRLDSVTYRHRINKLGSLKDTEQKLAGQFFQVV